MSKKVFVTGGNGFIGSHLVDKLVVNSYDVTVLTRQNSDLSFLPLDRVRIYIGDLRDSNSLMRGMRNCEIVFHAAGLISDWGKKNDFYDVNVTGTKNLLEAAKINNIKRIVLISTAGVLGEEDCLTPKSEQSPYKDRMAYFLSGIFESGMNHYRYTKMLAEKEAIKFCKENDINLTIIRPVWVYGPREFHAGPFEFCKSLLSGYRILPMGKNNKFHVIYVKDLAGAIMKAGERNFAGIQVFNIGNPEAPNIREYFNLFCDYLGVKQPLYAPSGLFYPLGFLFEALATLFDKKKPPLLTRARVKMFYCNNIYDVSKSKEVLGFAVETSLDEGVKETVEWWKQNGYLQKKNVKVKPLRQKYITGLERMFLDLRMGTIIFTRYFLLLLKRKISLKQYLVFVKRIIILSEVLSYNKAVRINKTYKIHLYLPAFPTKAFYKAIDKFLFLDEETIPTTVVLSMTKACAYNCTHCYQKNDGGEDLSIDKLIKVAQDIQNVGVSMFDIEGGEPLLKFERLFKLIQSLDSRNEIWINTTGHTLTYEKALRLKETGLYGIMVSIHHWLPEGHDKFVGKKGAFAIACSAIKTFQKVGVNTVINCCPSLEMINDSGIEKMMHLARKLNCSFVQFIHEKPAGAWLNRGNTLMDKDLLDGLCKKHIVFNKKHRFRKFPSISMQVFESSPLAFGCTAGGIERFYVNAHGEVQPCEFMNISFGNVQEEEFIEIYKRMRDRFKKPTLAWLCNKEYRSILNYIKNNNITSLPLKREATERFMESWDSVIEVPLYKRMKLCEKV